MSTQHTTVLSETSGDPTLQSKGSFLAGTQACFFFTFVDLSGQPYDPFEFTATVTDEDGTELVSSDSIEKIQQGKWVYAFKIPSTTTPGKYILILDYQVETIDGTVTETFTEDFLVVEKTTNGIITLREIASRSFLESLIGVSQRIPLWHEPARFNKSRTMAELSFPRWNQSARNKVFLNGEPLESGYTIDYCKGWISFSNALGSFDEVTASYNFRWFTDDELDGFIEQGVNEFNIYPPQTTDTIKSIEDRWIITALYAAAINVIRRWMMDIQFAEPAKIFGTLKRAQDVFTNMETLKKNYEDDKKTLLDLKKYGPYTGLTKTVTVPEFTLPGGRCIAYNTRLLFLIDNILIYETIEYGFHKSPSRIYILSDNDGSLSFEPVSKIWKSGKKSLLRISDANGNYIDVSKDHIIFANNKEVTASDVKIDDVLTICDRFKIVQSTVTSIDNIPEQETYDIEVPSTENLFANNIKCHNSRWFRYLFKGS